MEPEAVKDLIIRELPGLLRRDAVVRDLVKRLAQDFPSKSETESRFDRMLDELRSDREASERKWDEQQCADREYRAEQAAKWDAQERRWEQNFAEIKALNRRHDTTLGALGAHWGLRSEQSFRSALAGILEKSFGVKVQNYLGFDAAGVVFNHPAQIELDVLIKNGLLILCELKSSMSFADVSIFARKVAFYEKEHGVKSSRRLVISPMVDPRANMLAQQLNLEVYSHAEELAEDGSATRAGS